MILYCCSIRVLFLFLLLDLDGFSFSSSLVVFKKMFRLVLSLFQDLTSKFLLLLLKFYLYYFIVQIKIAYLGLL
uniref:Uncharacterized protein n=1 Tax=Rhizophora mucronata TaxID=61149 RepID=A0A2P2PSE9_RHIMU